MKENKNWELNNIKNGYRDKEKREKDKINNYRILEDNYREYFHG